MTYGDLIVLIIAVVITIFCIIGLIYIVKNQVFEHYGVICIVMPIFVWMCALICIGVIDVREIELFLVKPIAHQ